MSTPPTVLVGCRPVDASRPGCFLFICFYIYFSSCQTNRIKIYRSNLRHIFTVGTKTMAVDDQSEISFSMNDVLLDERCRANQFLFVGWFYQQNWMHSHSPDGASCVILFNATFAGRRQQVAQPGGLTLGMPRIYLPS